MQSVILDKNGNEVFIGDYVLFGKPGNNGHPGEMYAGKVVGKNGYGIEIEGSNYRIKASHKITKVEESWAIKFQNYLK